MITFSKITCIFPNGVPEGCSSAPELDVRAPTMKASDLTFSSSLARSPTTLAKYPTPVSVLTSNYNHDEKKEKNMYKHLTPTTHQLRQANLRCATLSQTQVVLINYE